MADAKKTKVCMKSVLKTFESELEAKGLGESFFKKLEENLEEQKLTHELHEAEIDRMLNEKEDVTPEVRDEIKTQMRRLYIFSDACDMACCHELNSWIWHIENRHLSARCSYECDLDAWSIEWFIKSEERHSALTDLRAQMIEMIGKKRYSMLRLSPYYTEAEEAEVVNRYYSFQGFRDMNCFWLLEEKIVEMASSENKMAAYQWSVIELLIGMRKRILDKMWTKYERKRERLIAINELFRENIIKAYNAFIHSKVGNSFSQPLSYTINIKGSFAPLSKSTRSSEDDASQPDIASEVRNILRTQPGKLVKCDEWSFFFLGDDFPKKGEEDLDLFLYGPLVGRNYIGGKEGMSCAMVRLLYRLWKTAPYSLYDLLDLKDITVSIHLELADGKEYRYVPLGV